MNRTRLIRLAVWTFAVTATLAAALVVAPTEATAGNSVDCPGVHNISLDTYSTAVPSSRSNGNVIVALDWEAPISPYEAAIFCDDTIGFDVRGADGQSHYRLSWTAVEFALHHREYPNPHFVLPSHTSIRLPDCNWSVILYSHPPGLEDWFEYQESAYADRWGTPGCKRLSDLVRPAPRIGFAPVVSENPPSIGT